MQEQYKLIHIELIQGQYFESKAKEVEEENFKLRAEKAILEDKLMRATRLMLDYEERRVNEGNEASVSILMVTF